jgi:hypothetical protein|tara:strand:+ start:300 stop:425 length:126 start_codon:yes stop_codon:yes gene_type:complete
MNRAEQQMYNDISRLAKALEEIVKQLKISNDRETNRKNNTV